MIRTICEDENNKKGVAPYFQQHIIGGLFFLMVLLSIIFLLYLVLSWMWDDNRLPLSRMVLEGDLNHVTVGDIQHAFNKLESIGTFMSQDIKVLQDIISSIPWVSHAAIRKQWPDTIKIFLIEHNVEAIWNEDVLLSTKGDFFNADITQLKGKLVRLHGPKGSSQEVLDIYYKITPFLKSLGLKIHSIGLDERRAWHLILDNGIRLELGKKSLSKRINRFLRLYTNLGTDTSQNISYVDLRYDTGAAIGWFSKQTSVEVSRR
ncbi:cell division protein [Candidatus Photodesmus katoptron]|nr:cell division protein [Candidatus Photodesmus katoptron]